MGLVKCKNTSCNALLGSYEENNRKIIVHLFNVREALFRPQLQYKSAGSGADMRVIIMELIDGKYEVSSVNSLLSKNYFLEPAKMPLPKPRVLPNQSVHKANEAKRSKLVTNPAKMSISGDPISFEHGDFTITAIDGKNVAQTSKISSGGVDKPIKGHCVLASTSRASTPLTAQIGVTSPSRVIILPTTAQDTGTSVSVPMTSWSSAPVAPLVTDTNAMSTTSVCVAPTMFQNATQEHIAPTLFQDVVPSTSKGVVYNDAMLSAPLTATNPNQGFKFGVPEESVEDFDDLCKRLGISVGYGFDEDKDLTDFQDLK